MRISKYEGTDKGFVVFMSSEEALKLIKSLLRQRKNSNIEREEFYTSDYDEYFAIIVKDMKLLVQKNRKNLKTCIY